MQLFTDRLTLQTLCESDWALFEKLHKDLSVIKYVADPMTTSEIQARFKSRLAAWSKTSSHWLTLSITETKTANPVGFTGFFPQWYPYQQAELGFLISPEYQGKGYGKESTKAVIDFAFEQCDFHKLTANVTEGNQACSQMLLALGFTQEARLRDNFKLADEWKTDLQFGMLKGDRLSN
ncbi:GNAT family N-acetyltransferase [Catenovulum sp. SM1970]|uniref:GNAT family N-acetyltransferase n=1 Tax=Marinifaba aquimaris TaxID=2741323 RepID=UPI001573D11B|nr:GNAT family protein [Marinifaba aquimaris]NTS77777.1 GNAT family N-acetyltransferase [Marinifaba aquimaris]